jgi:hypothetical protein
MRQFKYTIFFLFGCILSTTIMIDLNSGIRYNLIDANHNLLAYKNVLKEKNKKIEEYKKAETHNLTQFKKLKDLVINTSIQLKRCSEYVKVKEKQLTRCI